MTPRQGQGAAQLVVMGGVLATSVVSENGSRCPGMGTSRSGNNGVHGEQGGGGRYTSAGSTGLYFSSLSANEIWDDQLNVFAAVAALSIQHGKQKPHQPEGTRRWAIGC